MSETLPPATPKLETETPHEIALDNVISVWDSPNASLDYLDLGPKPRRIQSAYGPGIRYRLWCEWEVLRINKKYEARSLRTRVAVGSRIHPNLGEQVAVVRLEDPR